jgi:hypothetical protein
MPVRILRIAGQLPTSLLAVSLVLPAVPALAQQNADKPPAADQQQSAANKEAAKVQRFLNAQRTLNGAAGNPECFDLGTKALFRLSQDDIDTAFRHLDLYDRFGCPSAHIQAAYRCLLLHPATEDRKPDDSKATVLDGTVDACWINPALPVAATATPTAPEQPAASPAAQNPTPAPAATPNPAAAPPAAAAPNAAH